MGEKENNNENKKATYKVTDENQNKESIDFEDIDCLHNDDLGQEDLDDIVLVEELKRIETFNKYKKKKTPEWLKKEEFYKECNVLTSTAIIMLHKLVDGGIGYEDALAIVASFISSHQNISQIKEESETKKDSLL